MGLYVELEGKFDEWDWDVYAEVVDVFSIIKLAAHIEVNLTKILRLSGGVSYRFINSLSLTSLSSADASGMGAEVSLKIGKL